MSKKQTLMDFFHRGSSSILDTLSGKKHTPDFAYARNQYLGSRLRIVGWIFIVLSPFWALFDHVLLPAQVLPQLRLARLLFFISLIAILLLSYWRVFARQQTTLAIILLLSPACFYAYLLFVTAPFELPILGNYQFIPFLLVATLSIFPLTLLESLLVGALVIAVQLYSFYIDATPATHLIQQLWLLCALLVMALTANHFHLNLLLRLYRQATHDQLTGLLNRHSLLDLMESDESGESHWQPLGVMLLDLDHFKKINDQYGHAVGDIVLRRFADLLREHRQPTDRIARYGGEEFLLIRDELNLEQLHGQAEQIRLATAALQINDLEGNPIQCTVSIGIAVAHPDEPLTHIIQRADEALYAAKRAGRNQVHSHALSN